MWSTKKSLFPEVFFADSFLSSILCNCLKNNKYCKVFLQNFLYFFHVSLYNFCNGFMNHHLYLSAFTIVRKTVAVLVCSF